MTPVGLTEIALAAAAMELAKRDRELRFVFDKYGPPPMWARPAGFETLIHIILEQQVSLAAAATMLLRLKNNIVPFRPTRMIELGEGHLRSLGLTRQKASYCLDLARRLADKRLSLSRLARANDADARAALIEVKGIGSWSADVYLLMVLRRPDIFPATDLALVSAVTRLKELPGKPSTNQLLEFAEAWRPFRSVAARMLWQYYLAQREEVRAQRAKQ